MGKYIFDNLDRIFSLQEVSDSKVIIKVNGDSPLTIAQYPFIEKQFAYITVTRGKEHILTIVYEDGHTWSFHWGRSGHTLISEEVDMLKWAVKQFIQENDIVLDYDGGSVYDATIFYNDNFDKWELVLYIMKSENCFIYSDTARDAQSMIEECKKYVLAEKWEKGKAQTGIDHWVAKNFKVLLK